MSTRMTRGSVAEAALVDKPRVAVLGESLTPTSSKTPLEKGARAKSSRRADQSNLKAKSALAAVPSGPSTSVSEVEKDPDSKIKMEIAMTPVNVGKKRKRKALLEAKIDQDGDDYENLPHNLGKVQRGKKSSSKAQGTMQVKQSAKTLATKKASVKKEENGDEEDEMPTEASDEVRISAGKAAKASPAREKKSKMPSKKGTYGITEGVSPFPSYPHPTPKECYEVAKMLRKAHPHCHPRPKTIPEPSQIIAGCGEVPSILDAMIRTLLSAATNGRNSSNAYQGMVQRYGNRKTGVGKGSVDYNAVRLAPQSDLEKAIASGGLAKNKSKNIKAILDMVYEENQKRRKDLMAAKGADNNQRLPVGKGLQESEEQKDAEIALAEENILSLDHLYYLPTYAAIAKFITYPGIGVKTAACVSLFCMQRDCFAVDTHVFRLCKLLGWVPDQSAPDYVKGKGEPRVDRDPTFSHLEVKIPDELKYDLHQLFIAHGKRCPRCRGGATANSAGWDKGCPLDELVDRARLGKGGSTAKSPKLTGKTLKKGKKAGVRDEELDEDEDVEMSDLVDDEDDDNMEEALPDLDDEGEYKSPLKRTEARRTSSKRRP